MNYKEALDYIHNTSKFGMNFGLSRMKGLMEYFGNPHLNLKCIHIAGTNGKGSCAATINEILINQGFNVGLYTSPFIEDFRERIQINKDYISEEDLAEYTNKVKDAVDFVVKKGLEHPTEFEIITTIMFLYFNDKNIDYAVVEVGLGGDLDSTNILNPILSVITSISFDHMGVLGDTIEEIAKAKAGIIKNAPVVAYNLEDKSRYVIEETALKNKVSIDFIDDKNVSFIEFNKDNFTQRVSFKLKGKEYIGNLNLLGLHQLNNANLALNAVIKLFETEGVSYSINKVIEALETVKWMGRFEVMNKTPLFIIDGAHNTDGIYNLKKSMDFYLKDRKYVLILGILSDKETHKMADIIAKEAKKVICVTPNSQRASMAMDLYDYIKSFNKNVTYFESYEDAINDALSFIEDNDYIIAAGSLYMVGDLRKLLRERYSIK